MTVSQKVLIFGNPASASRPLPINTATALGIVDDNATTLSVTMLEQIDFGVTVTLQTAGGQTVALFGGQAADEIIGRQFPALQLSQIGNLRQLEIQASGRCTVLLEARE